jgi:hypothetical protein
MYESTFVVLEINTFRGMKPEFKFCCAVSEFRELGGSVGATFLIFRIFGILQHFNTGF